MNTNLLSYIPSIVGLISIGIFVLLNGRNIRNKVFALFNFLIAIWLAGLLSANLSHSVDVSLWFFRSALLFSSLGILMFYYFALLFPYSTRTTLKKQIIYSIPLLVVSFISLTPFVVSTVKVSNFITEPQNVGFLYVFSDIVSTAYILIAAAILFFKLKKSDAKQKKQVKFVLIGLLIAVAVNVFTGYILTLLKINTDYINFGGFSLLAFSLFVAYAMIRHGFLDIRLIVARTMGYIFSLSTIATIYSVILFGILSRFLDLKAGSSIDQYVYVILAVFLSFTFPPIKSFFDKLSNRLFYRDAYDSQAFLDSFNKILVSTYVLNPLLKKSAEIIEANLKPTYCVFMVHETKSIEGHIVGTERHPTLTNEINKLLYEAMSSVKGKVIFVDSMDEKHIAYQKLLQSNNISVVAQLAVHDNDNGIGYLVMGPKKSGNFYNSQDMGLVEIINNELVIAVQNALHTEEIENFNLTLQERVDEATRKLRRANDKLKALDESKDDFISMASHQLRTPLTSIKGYISMVLEGDAGKVSPMQHEMLGQAFFSSQRMVYLISDLLNVSRLKTGKFVIERSKVNLATMVAQELDQLKETAAARQLTLTHDSPKDFPDLMLDETKTRQVIMNFVDNAIYYTPAGGHINVKLIDNPNNVELRVEDDGIGVSVSDQHHLFTKFYRAGNARKARPDGTGLGLFMAKKVIIAEEGSLIFDSKEGKGSTFGFVFYKSKAGVPK